MIRQLRRKMVATAMVSLFVVLTVILCAIHWVNYRAIVTSSDGVLDVLGANRGMLPRPGPEGFSPEMPYEARYFSVLLGPQGQTIVVDTGKIAAVDQQEAVEYATQVWQGQSTRGFLGEYRYRKVWEGVDCRIIFLDCGRRPGSPGDGGGGAGVAHRSAPPGGAADPADPGPDLPLPDGRGKASVPTVGNGLFRCGGGGGPVLPGARPGQRP